MKDKITEIKFIKYNGIEGYIELMKHDIEPLNDPECKRLDLCYNGKDIKALLEYINYLQNENEKLKSKIDEVVNKQQFIEEKLDYKSRIDKAIEYIKGHIIEDSEYENYMQCEREEKEELLDILQGSDKDE